MKKSKIATWDKMKKELTRKLLPNNYWQNNFKKTQNLMKNETRGSGFRFELRDVYAREVTIF